MKKFLTIVAAFALVLGLSQCKKPNVPEYTGPIGDRIIQKATLTASNGDNGAKVDIQEPQIPNGTLELTWEEGDNIYAYDGFGNVSVLTLNGTGGSSSGTFDGKITVSSSITTDHDITFYYYGNDVNVDNIMTAETTIDFSEQYGLLYSDAKVSTTTVKGKLIAFGKAKYNEAGNYSTTLLVPFAIAKLAFKSFTDTGGDIPVTRDDNNMPVGYTISADGKIKAFTKNSGDKVAAGMTYKGYDPLTLIIHTLPISLYKTSPKHS